MKRTSEVCGVLTHWLLSLSNVCKVFQDTAVQELRKELSALQTIGMNTNDMAGIGDNVCGKDSIIPCLTRTHIVSC